MCGERGRGGGGYKHEKEGYGTVKCFENHWHLSGPRITFWSEWWSLGQNQLKTPGVDHRHLCIYVYGVDCMYVSVCDTGVTH